MAHGMISYPHPVLGNSDDFVIGGTDAVEVECTILDEKVSLDITGLDTKNPTLGKLIEDGAAVWVARVECARTYYRRAKLTADTKLSFDIDGRDLDGTVTVDISLCTKGELPKYAPVGLHPDYGSQSFSLAGGEVLALAGHFVFSVDKDFDPLRASARSLMTVMQGDHEVGPFRVDLDGDLIEVALSKADWESWNAVKGHSPAILHSAVVVPALIHALDRLEDYKGSKWADRLTVLEHRVSESHKPVPTDSLGRAQLLLLGPKELGPLGRGLASVQSLIDMEA